MEFIRRLLDRNVEVRTTQQQPKGNNIQKPVRQLGFLWLVILLGVFLIGSLWLFVRQQINYDYDRTIEEASKETMNLAKSFEEHVRRVIAGADEHLLNLKQEYERDGLSGPHFAAYVVAAAKDPAINQVTIANEQGILGVSLIEQSFGRNISDREYFQFHRNTVTETLNIGKLIIGKTTGEASIPLSRRVNKQDGAFGGIVYIGVKPDYFRSFYQKIDLGQDRMIIIMGIDGFIRVRRANDNVEGGQDSRGSPLWNNIQTGRPYGSYVVNGFTDGVNRVISYRVMPEYSIVISVGKSIQVALAPFEKRKQDTILGASLVSLFIVVICGLLIYRAAKQRALHMERESTLLELRKANVKLAEQAQLLELARDYIMVCDLNYKIIYWNRGAESGYGWLASEAIGQTGRILLQTESPVSVEYIINSLLTEGRWEGELTHIRRDGKQIVVQSYQTLYRDAANNPVSIMEINHDITEQKKFEAELARLDRLNIIGEMAAGIGHEVRNPMTTVRGYLQRFAWKPDLAEHRESFALMIEELDRANAIISEFLGLAKNKAVTLASTNLNMIIRSLFPLLLADAMRRGNDIEMELEDIPDVLADEKELRQCILNLVNNGLDAMPEGGKVTIGTAEARGRVVMTVRDRGPGIPPEIQDKLGTPFMTTKEKGTGLGLPVCYRIAQRHQATIEVETSPQGTAFRFIFNKKIVTG